MNGLEQLAAIVAVCCTVILVAFAKWGTTPK